MSESTSALVIGLWLGLITGCLITLTLHDQAIKEHKFKEYSQTHTNNITFEEWKELKQ